MMGLRIKQREYLSEIKDSRIIIVDRDICRGVSQARNLGLSLARGDLCYVC